ncbi:MAG: hypothetical protein ACRDTG_06810 [Pseudonocardiaceae bacterium]
MTADGVDLTGLVKDLRRQVTAPEGNLRTRSDEVEESTATRRND